MRALLSVRARRAAGAADRSRGLLRRDRQRRRAADAACDRGDRAGRQGDLSASARRRWPRSARPTASRSTSSRHAAGRAAARHRARASPALRPTSPARPAPATTRTTPGSSASPTTSRSRSGSATTMPTASAARSAAARPAAAWRCRSSSRSCRRSGQHHAPRTALRGAVAGGAAQARAVRDRHRRGDIASDAERRRRRRRWSNICGAIATGRPRRHAIPARVARRDQRMTPARCDTSAARTHFDAFGRPLRWAPAWRAPQQQRRGHAAGYFGLATPAGSRAQQPQPQQPLRGPATVDPRASPGHMTGRFGKRLMMHAHAFDARRLLAAGCCFRRMPATAQDFRIEEATSVTRPRRSTQLKPRTIVFTDCRSDELADPAVGSSGIEDWAQARPLQQQFLSLYPGYAEPMSTSSSTARDALSREAAYVRGGGALRAVASRRHRSTCRSYATAAVRCERIDPAIKHQAATAEGLTRPNEAKVVAQPESAAAVVRGPGRLICMHSTYRLEGRLPVGMRWPTRCAKASRQDFRHLEFDSELTVLTRGGGRASAGWPS